MDLVLKKIENFELSDTPKAPLKMFALDSDGKHVIVNFWKRECPDKLTELKGKEGFKVRLLVENPKQWEGLTEYNFKELLGIDKDKHIEDLGQIQIPENPQPKRVERPKTLMDAYDKSFDDIVEHNKRKKFDAPPDVLVAQVATLFIPRSRRVPV